MRSLQVILCMAAVAVASAKPGFLHSAYSAPAAVVTGPLAVSSQYHAQDTLGQYSYGYSGGPSAKAETKTADGITRGGYSYIDSNGIVQTTNYVSDSVNGFRVAATNLPVHVSAPIHDTPEVAAAKVAHAVAYNDAAVAAATAPDVPEPEAIAAGSTFYTALPSAVTGHAYTALPSAVTGHSYTAPGIVASANGAGGFAYSTASIVPTYAPSYYTAVLPASTASTVYTAAPTVYTAAPTVAPTVYTAAPTVYTAAPTVVASHAYAAPGVVATANTAGGFAYSVGPTYAAHYYSTVLPSVPVLVNGVPADTPEVAAAKAAHYAAHIEEKLRHFG